VRNNWLIPYGGALLLIALGAIALFYFARGPIDQHGPDTGRKIERFTPFERAAHWANAIAFVHPRHLGRGDGVRQVLPVAGHRRPRCSAASPTC
jgi:hypothetical protein